MIILKVPFQLIKKTLYIFICSLIFYSLSSIADDEQDLFKKVFGNSFIESPLELQVLNQEIGQIKVRMQGSTIVAVETKTYYAKLNAILKKSMNIPETEWTQTSELPFPLEYNPEKLNLNLIIDQKLIAPTFYDVGENLKAKYAGEVIVPAPLAANLSYTLDKTYGDEALGGDYFSTSVNSFVNIHGVILSTRGFYQESSKEDGYWFRGDTNLTKDIESKKIRLQAGDIYTQSFSFLNSQSIGGVSIQKQFSIDPYSQPFTRGSEELKLTSRSQVKTYVNGNLYRQETLPAGNYRLTNLPLLNGINFIRLEIKDAQGIVKIIDYDIPISIATLRKGVSNFALSSGKVFTDSDKEREYVEDNITSGYYQYGVNDYYTFGGFGQVESNYNLAGLSNGFISKIGNIFVDLAHSQNLETNEVGQALAASWQYQPIGISVRRGFALVLRAEKFISDFRENSSSTNNLVDTNYESSISVPLHKTFSLNLGFAKSIFQDKSFNDRDTYRGSLNWRISPLITANVYASKTVNTLGESETQASLFLNWRFSGDSNSFGSIYKDLNQDSSRVSLTKDNSNQLYSPRIATSFEKESERERVDLITKVSTSMADIFIRGSYEEQESDHYQMYGATLSSSILLAASNDSGLGMAFGRPTQSSFAIFKPSEDLKDQKLAIKSTSPFADTESPIFGDLALPNLLSYQFREVQVDTGHLDIGTTLEKEKFVLLPKLKSGHLVSLRDKGLLSIEGILLKEGKPVKLKVGKLGQNVFFTDRNGYFFIDGIKEGKFNIEVMGVGSTKIHIPAKNKKGFFDLGKLELK